MNVLVIGKILLRLIAANIHFNSFILSAAMKIEKITGVQTRETTKALL